MNTDMLTSHSSNIFAALALYWLIRMPKNKKDKKEKPTAEADASNNLEQKPSSSQSSDAAQPQQHEKAKEHV